MVVTHERYGVIGYIPDGSGGSTSCMGFHHTLNHSNHSNHSEYKQSYQTTPMVVTHGCQSCQSCLKSCHYDNLFLVVIMTTLTTLCDNLGFKVC